MLPTKSSTVVSWGSVVGEGEELQRMFYAASWVKSDEYDYDE